MDRRTKQNIYFIFCIIAFIFIFWRIAKVETYVMAGLDILIILLIVYFYTKANLLSDYKRRKVEKLIKKGEL